jgi:membrane-associated phospholipid phosphatase
MDITADNSLPAPTPELNNALAPAARRFSVALILSIGAMWFFTAIAHDVAKGTTYRTDEKILKFLAKHQTPQFRKIMRLVSIMAGPYFQSSFGLSWIAYFIAVKRFWPDGVSMSIAGTGGVGLIVGLKRLFHRPRPQVIYDRLGYSFPSGHSFFALVIYAMACYWMARDKHPKHQKLLWSITSTMIFLVGFSRVDLGEHYPSDVVAGYAVGLPWLWACLAIPSTFHRNGRDLSPREAAETPAFTL